MNVLLFAPGLLLVYLRNTGLLRTIKYLAICGVTQVRTASHLAELRPLLIDLSPSAVVGSSIPHHLPEELPASRLRALPCLPACVDG